MTKVTEYLKFTEMLETILNSDGSKLLPNSSEVVDTQEGLNLIAKSSKLYDGDCYRLRVQEFNPPLRGVQTCEITYYPKVFLNTAGMGSRFDGSGVYLVGNYPKSKVFKFSFCEHDYDESGANHGRGWHPKYCKKCGFDASIDSGD